MAFGLNGVFIGHTSEDTNKIRFQVKLCVKPNKHDLLNKKAAPL